MVVIGGVLVLVLVLRPPISVPVGPGLDDKGRHKESGPRVETPIGSNSRCEPEPIGVTTYLLSSYGPAPWLRT